MFLDENVIFLAHQGTYLKRQGGKNMANCMGCPSHSELMSLRAFKERITSGREYAKYLEEIDSLKKRIADENEHAARWKAARDEAEKNEKAARAELRAVQRENEALKKRLSNLENEAEIKLEKAVKAALKDASVQHAHDIEELEQQHLADMTQAVNDVREPMQAEIDTLHEKLHEATLMIEKMKLALHQRPEKNPVKPDGTNSGTPTSQTPYDKDKVIPATVRGEGKTKGGQPGHAPHFPQFFDDNDPDLEIERHPVQDRICPCCGKPMKFKRWINKDRADIEITIRKHRDMYEELECEECGSATHEEIPVEQSGNLSYGATLKMLMVYLMVVGNVPMEKVADFAAGISGNEVTPTPSFAAKTSSPCCRKFDRIPL